ncbi:MAG: type II toxin-antitoxin system Phd/YefM family antitoxin [Bryobacteraceae bacterium]
MGPKNRRLGIKRPTSPTNFISAMAARAQFGSILRRATEKRERFVVHRHGEPSVVIMSLNDYIDTIAPTPAWMRAIHEEAQSAGLDRLTMKDIDAEIAAVRRERSRRKAIITPGK